MSTLSLVLVLFLLMAGVAQLPPSLDRLAYHEIQPTKFLQETTRRGTGSSTRYMLVGLDEQQKERSFAFPDNPQVLVRLARITMDPAMPTRVRLWVERNDFAQVLQLQQGDRMVWSYAELVVERRQAAHERFLQAGLVLVSSAAFFLIARKARVSD
ncbi:hypothetical protein ACLBKS_09570 [Hylemonella sp. W303a]|uniref:hypothetical protein n=1 Tax=Hylemonella sp. W303a TaxID=3389873 RepID=UPI00396B0D7F